ncbi:restriction endonuclease subunit S [Maribacter thermophilus]|uniref:restriction endonuclease subunit S n=1 Tax=Maribacter thermophilus TaxID=1197874 RepID=UPI000A04F4C1|nr:restriction endonuclease subunit S [Maribacter thermophilus]
MKEDWIECTVENVAQVLTGGTPSKKRPEFYSKDDYPFYKPTDLNAGINVIKSNDYLSSLGFENSRKAIKNSILVTCIGATIGKTGLIKNEGAFNQQINALFPKKGISNIFLYYQIIGSEFQQQIKANASSTTLPILNKSKFLKLKLNIPPLVEQKAIVKKIEELFSSLDSGIADLKKAQDQLKIYRQAVLKKAFEGELTKEKASPELIKLGDVIDKPRYGTSKKCSLEVKGIPVLRIPNIGSGIINTDELKYASFEEKEISTLKLKEGDILTIRSNGSVDLVGKCALITKKDINYLYAGYLIRLRPNHEKINSKYLLHCLSSHSLRVQIESKAKSTSGVNNINSGELASLEIPLFTIKEQHQIVSEIESRLSVCDTVEKDIADSLEKAQALRQSILKKAFEGKLLSEAEIADCKQHPDYEPASVLLERIKEEKKK